MLDGPYANSTWNGKEIAVIDVPADAPKSPTVYTVKVPQVEGLSGKHAIYLVAEGPDLEAPKPRNPWERAPQTPFGLFDLHGIGFTKGGATIDVPQVPQIEIVADGNKLTIPDQPVFFTNYNGYYECNHYQVYGPLTDKSTLKVTSNNPNVKITVSKIVDGRATAKCEYNGKEKVFLIN